MKIGVVFLAFAVAFAAGQRIMTIQLDAVQYYISRMNPYSPTLNYFLAYQYCRSLGLQLVSFESKEKADSLTTYLKNAGYKKYSFWTSGNKIGTKMYMWMSTGVPFNMTFDYMLKDPKKVIKVPPGTEPQRVARDSGNPVWPDGCVAMGNSSLAWEARNCFEVKDFICEQTRCYYYNYGSVPVSATQGNQRVYLTTTTSPTDDTDNDAETNEDDEQTIGGGETEPTEDEEVSSFEGDASGAIGSSTGNDLDNDESTNADSADSDRPPEDPVVGRLMTTAGSSVLGKSKSVVKDDGDESSLPEDGKDSSVSLETAKATRPVDIPDITSLFTDGPLVQSRKETAFDGLETHEVRSSSRSNVRGKLEHREGHDSVDYESSPGTVVTEAPDSGLVNSHTVGPYDSVQEDYVDDQPDGTSSPVAAAAIAPEQSAVVDEHQQQQDEESSTMLPEAEPGYRYNMKWRSLGKVLDPPSK